MYFDIIRGFETDYPANSFIHVEYDPSRREHIMHVASNQTKTHIFLTYENKSRFLRLLKKKVPADLEIIKDGMNNIRSMEMFSARHGSMVTFYFKGGHFDAEFEINSNHFDNFLAYYSKSIDSKV